MAEVEFRAISKSFGRVRALDDIWMRVSDGEFMVLVGPSGCGKTTLLRVLAGLEEPTAGEVLIDGNVVNPVPPAKRDISMVFQSYALYPHMSVYDNIAFPLRMRNVSPADIDARVKEVASVLGIEELLRRRPRELSGGQRQRVAVARAIVRKPKVLLMDEPLSNLDAQLRFGVRAELIRIQRRLGTTVVYVTHDQVEAMTMGHRIAVMHGGKVVQVGAPEEVYNSPANTFVATFIGSPRMNLLTCTLEGNRLVLPETAQGIAVPDHLMPLLRLHQGKSVVVGVRPEHVRLGGTGVGGQLSGRVDLVERLGAESLVHVFLDGVAAIGKVPGTALLERGQGVAVDFDWKNIHFFDPESGENLRRGGTA